MIGDMVTSILGMFASFLGPILPYLAGVVAVVAFAVVLGALWWARPHHETDPTPLIDRSSSDWLGQP